MTDWIDTRDRLPHDLQQKLVIAYNTFQQRYFYALAFYDPHYQWSIEGGKVLYWMDLPPMPDDANAFRR